MNALIVDDERLAREELKRLLEPIANVTVVGEAPNADKAIEKIGELKPDLIFLDIQMPGKTGFEMLEELDAAPEVVFTTAYDEYALKAFEVNALDYLLKPVESARLAEAVEKVEKRLAKSEEKPEADRERLSAEDRVFVKDGERCWFVKLGDVRLFESEGNYVRLFFDKHKPLILKTLNYLDQRLDPDSFFRASRKHILNLKWIDNVEPWLNGGLLVKLTDGAKVEVSRRQSVKFKERLSL
ncbi:MAG: response regulator [Ignavibacteriales bacterium]|nr:response regulator [Ignavibacteriales bacterium]